MLPQPKLQTHGKIPSFYEENPSRGRAAVVYKVSPSLGRLSDAVGRGRRYSSSSNPLLHRDPLEVTVNSWRLAEGECRLTLTSGIYPRLESSEENKADMGSGLYQNRRAHELHVAAVVFAKGLGWQQGSNLYWKDSTEARWVPV